MLLSNHRERLRSQMRCQGQEKDFFSHKLRGCWKLLQSPDEWLAWGARTSSASWCSGHFTRTPACPRGPSSWSAGGRARGPSAPWGLGSRDQTRLKGRARRRNLQGREKHQEGKESLGKAGRGEMEGRTGRVGGRETESQSNSRRKHDGGLRHGRRKLIMNRTSYARELVSKRRTDRVFNSTRDKTIQGKVYPGPRL